MTNLNRLTCCLLLLLFGNTAFSNQKSPLDSLSRALEETSVEEEQVRILIKMARATYDRDSSVNFAKRAYDLSNSSLSILLSANQMAWELKSNYLYDSAKHYANQAISASQEVDLPLETSDIFNTYGSIYYNQGNYDSAIFMHQQALTLRENSQDKRAVAVTLNNMSLIYQEKGERDKSRKMIMKSISIYQELKLWKEMADSNLNLGNGYANTGKLDSAHLFFQNALKGYDSLGLDNLKTFALVNLGFVSHDLGRQEETKKYMLETIDIQLEIGNKVILGHACQSLGSVFIEQHDLDSGLYYSNKGLDYFTQAKSSYGRALCLSNLGRVFLEQKNYSQAFDNLNESLEIRKKMGRPDGMAKLEISLGSVHFAMENHKMARQHLEKGIAIAKEVKNIAVIKEGYLGLHEVSIAQKQYKPALEYYTLFHLYSDSLVNENNLAKVEELNISYDTEKKEQQINFQEVVIAQEKAANERKFLLIIGLIVLLLLIIVIGLLLKNRLQKQQELTLKQREIEYKELQLDAVIESQEKERTRFSQDIHDGFGQLISILKLNVHTIHQEENRDKKDLLFEKSSKVLDDMYGELKNICFNLMPQSLVQFGLIPPLREFADKINLSEKLVVEVLAFDMENRLSELQEISIYRIVQEWVNNILKYSDAARVTIQLTRDENEITLTIEDDGSGFESSKLMQGNGNGWKNIMSRTNHVKGALELDTTPGLKGSMLFLNVPIQRKIKEKIELTH